MRAWSWPCPSAPGSGRHVSSPCPALTMPLPSPGPDLSHASSTPDPGLGHAFSIPDPSLRQPHLHSQSWQEFFHSSSTSSHCPSPSWFNLASTWPAVLDANTHFLKSSSLVVHQSVHRCRSPSSLPVYLNICKKRWELMAKLGLF